MSAPLVVLFEDLHCLAVVKPAGLLTQAQAAPAGEPTLEAAVRRYLNPGDPAAPYLGTVHRLDRPVAGVVVWAKTPKAARRLAGQFAGHAVRKEYWAIVEQPQAPGGDAPGPQGDREEVWDDWLTAPDAMGVVRVVAPNTPGARRALTRVRIERGVGARLPAGTAWLRLWPQTGRTHQLRAGAARRGRPILGDRAYGATRAFPCGIALYARALALTHPILRTPLEWVAPVPDLWAAAGIQLPAPDSSGA
jgi:23S rRNA pseudouridine1911/1915/1917 synthase